MLSDMIDHSLTDKDTTHSYLSVYEELLQPKKYSAKNVLEVGIFNGGSIQLWKDYFPNAIIYGIDIENGERVCLPHLFSDTRVVLYTDTDAYVSDTISQYFSEVSFDIIIDDGSHRLEHMKAFITLYIPLLSKDGIMIIEDIQYIGWINELQSCVPDTMSFEFYDRRNIKDRYDDVLVVIRHK